LNEDLSQVFPLDQDSINLEELAKHIAENFPNIHSNELATWRYILEKG
jgi:hypothetical protein